MTNQTHDTAAGKATIRSRLLAARRALAPEDRSALSAAACALLLAALDAGPHPETVAAYSSFGTEPDTGPLLAGLLARGVRVLMPILENDNDLAWGWYSGPDSLVRGNAGPMAEPAVSLGREAVLDAALVVVPGLAVDPRGLRLGRGGGSYDRVLARIAARPSAARPRTYALLYPGEVGVAVPADRHDQPVDAAVTAEGVHDFG
jgi:5-formyltetrahydrofolate cyclo-ligase